MVLKKTISINADAVVSKNDFLFHTKSNVSDEFYIKVVAVNGSKDNVEASVSFTGEKSSGHKVYTFVPGMNGSNFIKQSYEYLKTQPEFVDAVDC